MSGGSPESVRKAEADPGPARTDEFAPAAGSLAT